MALPIFITITIIISNIFFFQNKRLSFVQNTIAFMVLALVLKNYLTIMTLQLNILKTSEDDLLFLCFLIQRELIKPLIALSFTNKFLNLFTWKKKIAVFIGSVFLLSGINVLSVVFEVVGYEKWSLFNANIADILYLSLSLAVAKLILVLHQWESRQNDSRV